MSVKLDYKDTVKENLLLGCSSRCSRKRDGKYLEKIGTTIQTQTQQLST
jgi:hypothetical protein